MLKQVVYWINNKENITRANLDEQLNDTDIRDCMLVLDKKQDKLFALENNIPYIAYNIEKTDYSSKYVTDTIPVDMSYLNMIYCHHYNCPWEVLETERLIIREFSADDIDSLYDIYDDFEVKRFVGVLSENKEEETQILKAYIKNVYGFYGYGYWAVVLKENGKIIGKAGIENLEDGKAGLGYIIQAAYRRKGYAKEACRAIVEYAHNMLDIEPVCKISPENTASIGLAAALDISIIM